MQLCLSLLQWPLGDILRGQIESEPLEDNVINLDDFKIIFDWDSHHDLKNSGRATDGTAQWVCPACKHDKGRTNVG